MKLSRRAKLKIGSILFFSFLVIIVVALFLFFSVGKIVAPEINQNVSQSASSSTPAENNYQLKIDKIGVSAPIIINVDGNDKDGYNKALEGGVAHLLGSALPGKEGNTFIFGHSSYFAWKPGDYKEVFKGLDNLNSGDTIIIQSDKNTYTYKVNDKRVVEANDVSVANQNYSEKKLTIMTCWPIGSDKQRLVVVGMLQQ